MLLCVDIGLIWDVHLQRQIGRGFVIWNLRLGCAGDNVLSCKEGNVQIRGAGVLFLFYGNCVIWENLWLEKSHYILGSAGADVQCFMLALPVPCE